MPQCVRMRFPDGSYGFVRMAKPRKRKCTVCGRPGTADRECDGVIEEGGTCDRNLCERCSVKPAPNIGLCPAHAAQAPNFERVTP